MNDLNNYTDEQLISMMRTGEPGVMDFLMEKYKNLVRKRANALYLMGGETEDLIQEGMIGLFKAISDYKEERSSFFHFADLCINRQLYHAIESANRKKHGPLNTALSLSMDEGEEKTSMESVLPAGDDQNPEQILIARESMEQLMVDLYSRLSKMERSVLDLYLEGMNYRQIAEYMGKSDKSIDNALQRIRSKINTQIES